jgi:hypothetical protein
LRIFNVFFNSAVKRMRSMRNAACVCACVCVCVRERERERERERAYATLPVCVCVCVCVCVYKGSCPIENIFYCYMYVKKISRLCVFVSETMSC